MAFPQPPPGDPLNAGDFDMSPSRFFSMQTKTNVSQIIIEKLSGIENILKAQLALNAKWFTMEMDRRQDSAFEAAKTQKAPHEAAFVREHSIADGLYSGLLAALAILFSLLYTKISEVVGHIGEMVLILKTQLFRDIINPIKEKFKTFKKYLEGIHFRGIGLGRIGEFVKMFGNFIGKIALMIPGMSRLLRVLPILGQFMMIVDFIHGFVVGLSGEGNLFSALREGILNIGKELMKFVVTITSGLLKFLGFGDASEWVEKNGNEFVEKIVGLARELIDGVVNVLISLFNITKAAIKGLLTKAASVLSSVGMQTAADTLTEASKSKFLNTETGSPTDAGNTVTPKTSSLFKGNAFEFFKVLKDDLLGDNGINAVRSGRNLQFGPQSPFTSPNEYFDRWSSRLQRDIHEDKSSTSSGATFTGFISDLGNKIQSWMVDQSRSALDAQEKELALLHQADVNLRRGGDRLSLPGQPIVMNNAPNISTSSMSVHQTVGSQLSTRNQESVLTHLFSSNVYFPE